MADKELGSPGRKSRLGRGLGSLLGGGNDSVLGKTVDSSASFEVEVAQEETSTEMIERHPSHFESSAEGTKVWQIEIEKLVRNELQPRKHFAKEKLEELAASIREQGILSPIVARKLPEGGLEIIAGERRWRAAQLAGLHRVPVLLKEAETQQVLELALIENIQRADLNPVEEALAYRQLMDNYQLSQQDVAKKVGKDRTTVTNSLRLLSLPPEVIEEIREEKLSTGHAKVLLGIADPKIQMELCRRIQKEKLSVRATEKLIQSIRTVEKSKVAPVSDKEMLKAKLAGNVAEELQKLVGSKVAVDYKNSKGKISLHFYSDDQFNEIVEKLKETWQSK